MRFRRSALSSAVDGDGDDSPTSPAVPEENNIFLASDGAVHGIDGMEKALVGTATDSSSADAESISNANVTRRWFMFMLVTYDMPAGMVVP